MIHGQQMLFGHEIKEDKNRGACSTYRANRNAYKILAGNPEGNENLEDKNIDKNIILKWIL